MKGGRPRASTPQLSGRPGKARKREEMKKRTCTSTPQWATWHIQEMRGIYENTCHCDPHSGRPGKARKETCTKHKHSTAQRTTWRSKEINGGGARRKRSTAHWATWHSQETRGTQMKKTPAPVTGSPQRSGRPGRARKWNEGREALRKHSTAQWATWQGQERREHEMRRRPARAFHSAVDDLEGWRGYS